MSFDYDNLRLVMRKHDYTVTSLARAIKLSRPYLSAKLHGKGYFTQTQIREISRILNLSSEEIDKCFFTLKVLKSNT